MLFFLGVVILLYSEFYLQSDNNLRYFLIILIVFIVVMILLLLSASSWSLMFFWDFLGVSSFFLVLYYFSQSSVVGSLATSLTSRLGDFFLVCLISPLLLFFTSFFWDTYTFFFIFLIFTSFTKSAQFPFMGWLPRAMAAPTPVSSLVHSSTLVTAGLVLLWLNSFFLFGSFFSYLLFWFSLSSMLFSGLLALFEKDMKKLIALSTLSQISFCFLSLSSGFLVESFFQMLGHAFSKSCLFMQAGLLIWLSYGQQFSLFFSSGSLLFVSVSSLLSLLSLCGFFYTSGFYTKEAVLSFSFYSLTPFFMFLIYMLSVSLTYFYCYRLWVSFCSFFSSFSSYSFFSSLSLFSVFPVLGLLWSILLLSSNVLLFPSFIVDSVSAVPYFFFLLFFFISFFFFTVFSHMSYGFLSNYFLGSFSRFVFTFGPLESFLFKFLLDFFNFFSFVRFIFSFSFFSARLVIFLGFYFFILLFFLDYSLFWMTVCKTGGFFVYSWLIIFSFINFMNWGFLWSSNDRASLLSWFQDYVNAWLFGVLLFVMFVILGLFLLRGYFKTVGLEYKTSELMCMFLPITILLFQLVPSLYLLYGGALLDVSSILTLKVVGHQWYWHYEYADVDSLSFDSFMKLIGDLGLSDSRLVSVDNRLVIPSQVNVRFCVTSADVIQSWSLPSMGVKVDAIPGILNVVSISFPLVGLFYGFCSELCGSNQSFMPITLEVSSWDSFLSWVLFSF